MSDTLSIIITGREIARLDAARKAFGRPVFGPEWLRDVGPDILAVEIADGGTVYRYEQYEADSGGGGLKVTLMPARAAARPSVRS